MNSAIDEAWHQILSEPTEGDLIREGWRTPAMIFQGVNSDAAYKRCIRLKNMGKLEMEKARLRSGNVGVFFRPIIKTR